MLKVQCNCCNLVVSQQWEFIFINNDVFQFKVSISGRSFIQFPLQNLRVLQFFRKLLPVRQDQPPSFCSSVTVAVRTNAIVRSVHGQQEYFQRLLVHVSRTRRLRWCRVLWLQPFFIRVNTVMRNADDKEAGSRELNIFGILLQGKK